MSHQAVVGDIVAIPAAAVSVISSLHEYAFHDWVALLAGLMAIAAFTHRFFLWVLSFWDNHDGD